MTWLDLARLAIAKDNAAQALKRDAWHLALDLRKTMLAVMLDTHGVSPLDRETGGHRVVVVMDGDLFEDMRGLAVLIDLTVVVPQSANHDGHFWIVPDERRTLSYGNALRVAASPSRLTMVVPNEEWVDNDLLNAVETVTHVGWDADVLAAWAFDRYGGPLPRFDGIDYGALSVRQVLFSSLSAKDAVSFRDELRSRQDVPVAWEQPKEAVVKPVDTSKVAKLSAMTGFGDARAWGLRLAEDLRLYRQGEINWPDVDKGMLLSGPPGTGKSTFARALAAEIGCELVVTTYDQWHQGNNGDSVSKGLNKLFETWRKKASRERPLLVFWDECDSVGSRGGNAQNESWFAPMVNAWLAFLDGATPREGIVVVGATNHADRVDPAMRRPGRLDRHFVVDLPDVATLRGILAYHAGWTHAAPGLDAAAKALRGRSPADVELFVRDVRRTARDQGRPANPADVVDAVRKTRRQRPEALDRLTAVHESGHALAAVEQEAVIAFLDVDEAVVVYRIPETGTMRTVERQIVMLLSARAAEIVTFGEPTAGAKLDLEEATKLARKAHLEFGLGGDVEFSTWSGEVSEPRANAILATLRKCEAEALALMTRRRHALAHLADVAQRERYLDGAEVYAAVRAADRQWEDAFFSRRVWANDDGPDWQAAFAVAA